jgi:hypothetical protein
MGRDVVHMIDPILFFDRVYKECMGMCNTKTLVCEGEEMRVQKLICMQKDSLNKGQVKSINNQLKSIKEIMALLKTKRDVELWDKCIEKVVEVIKTAVGLGQQLNFSKSSLFMMACTGKNAELVKLMLQYGANPDVSLFCLSFLFFLLFLMLL